MKACQEGARQQQEQRPEGDLVLQAHEDGQGHPNWDKEGVAVSAELPGGQETIGMSQKDKASFVVFSPQTSKLASLDKIILNE